MSDRKKYVAKRKMTDKAFLKVMMKDSTNLESV